jgi:MFS transporter, YNFM family, putative membrane transport protein
VSRGASGAWLRTGVIGLTAFLTVVDLFATQAILPSLAVAYQVSPAAMGIAVNATTMGMAAGGLAVAFFSRHIDRRRGILVSLALLAIPTALLASAPDLAVFTALRITQGLFMSCAFALTLAYPGERCSASDAGAAFAAYITGNVASNLIGRLLSAVVADHLGLATNFHVFAALNLAGAVLVYFTIQRATPMPQGPSAAASALGVWASHLRNPPLRASFAIGFLILFAFIGTFTYVNFVLVREPYSVGPMQLGFVYLVFLPSILTTPLAGALVDRIGTRPTLWTALTTAALGPPLLLQFDIATVLAGLALVAVGTFLAQATATGFVGKATASDRGAAAGIYLACYFFGGLIGSAVLGSCSTGSVGRPASMASPRRSHSPVFSRRASRRSSDRLRHHLMKNDALHGIGTFLPRCLRERLPGVLVAGPPAHGDAGGSEIDILGVALVLKARSEEANEMHLC